MGARLASGFVFTRSVTKSQRAPFVMYVLEPLTIQSSPSRFAQV